MNDNDWLRKRIKNKGCLVLVVPLVAGLVLLVA